MMTYKEVRELNALLDRLRSDKGVENVISHKKSVGKLINEMLASRAPKQPKEEQFNLSLDRHANVKIEQWAWDAARRKYPHEDYTYLTHYARGLMQEKRA
jgi:hypothetical protein